MYKRYQKKFDYSYSLGIYPTIELLTYRPQEVVKVILSEKSKDNNGADKIIKLCEENQFRIDINDAVIERLSPKSNCLGIGIFDKYTDELQQDKNHVVLVNPANAGNLGTILRTMIAFNFSDLAIIQPGVDVFMPEVIRSSMGSIFQVRVEYFQSINDYISKFSDRELFTLMTNGIQELGSEKLHGLYSLIFGNESSGLPDEYQNIGKSLKIKSTNSVDSLNLSIAVGIALYETSK